MIRINLFKKDSIDMNLLIGSLEKERFNMPMYNTDITLWKGVDNTIEFSIRNHDRKAIQIPSNGSVLKFVAINQSLKQKLEKELIVVNENLGRYKVVISNEELKNFDIGTFVGHVSVISDTEELLYTGTDWYPYFNVEIKPNKLEILDEPIILNNFNKEVIIDNFDGNIYNIYTSSVIDSMITPNHTFILKLSDFNGMIYIQGSNEENPEHRNDDWFTIETIDYTNEEEGYTGNITVSTELKCLYTRVQYKVKDDNKSIIEEIQYRN